MTRHVGPILAGLLAAWIANNLLNNSVDGLRSLTLPVEMAAGFMGWASIYLMARFGSLGKAAGVLALAMLAYSLYAAAVLPVTTHGIGAFITLMLSVSMACVGALMIALPVGHWVNGDMRTFLPTFNEE